MSKHHRRFQKAPQPEPPKEEPKPRALKVVYEPETKGCPHCNYPLCTVRSTQTKGDHVRRYVTCRSCTETYVRIKTRPIV